MKRGRLIRDPRYLVCSKPARARILNSVRERFFRGTRTEGSARRFFERGASKLLGFFRGFRRVVWNVAM